MRIGIIGMGRIGGGIARQLSGAGHELMVSSSRDPGRLTALAHELEASAGAGTPADAASFGDVVVISVPWGAVAAALDAAGSLAGKIVIDTTNQFGAPAVPPGQTAAQLNAGRMPGALYTKSFNTLTSGFQAQAAGRDGDTRVVQWLCGDDADAKQVVAGLIDDAGFVPMDIGPTAGCAVMEAPRRAGAVYGEEYRLTDARAVVDALRRGEPIPPTPRYAG